MEKVIFLDIDGVLQPGGRQERFEHDLDKLKEELGKKDPRFLIMDKYDIGATYYDWDPNAVKLLKKLIEQNNAKVVISSSWRRSKTLTQLKLLFALHDLDENIVDVTPMHESGRRAEEIQDYLNKHPEIKKFVILDDDSWSFLKALKEYFVYCPNIFNEEAFNKANTLLNQ